MSVLSDREMAQRTNHFVGGFAGATRNVHTREDIAPGTHHGFIVSSPTHEQPITPAATSTAADFAAHRSWMLEDPTVKNDPKAVQGSWTEGSEGHPADTTLDRGEHIDTGNYTEDKATALTKGYRKVKGNLHEKRQKAIFDLDNMSDVRVTKKNVIEARVKAAISPDRPRSNMKNPLFGE